MNSAPKDLLSIGFNQNHSLAIAQNGQVYSWGEDKYGQLGRGDGGRNDCSKTADCRLDISAIEGIENAVMVAPGYSHNLVLTEEGTVWAFGANGYGQLGNNTSTDSSTPVKVDFTAATEAGHIVQVVVSGNSSYALDDKGQVWGWGSDAYANLAKAKSVTLQPTVSTSMQPLYVFMSLMKRLITPLMLRQMTPLKKLTTNPL